MHCNNGPVFPLLIPFVCLHNPDIFIIPILLGSGVPEVGSEPKEQTAREEAEGGDAGFPVEHKGKEEPWHHGVGRLVLVVAERIGTDIHLKVSNSLDGCPADRVTRIAGNVIRCSGWMDVREPRIVRVWRPCVSRQLSGSDACGTHVIPKGRAYLLRIKVNPHWRPSEEWYEEGQERHQVRPFVETSPAAVSRRGRLPRSAPSRDLVRPA